MIKGRCLGLIGGTGVGATVHYYERLAAEHERRGRVLDLVMAHAETARVFEHVEAGDRNGLAEYLTEFIERLKAAGAEVAAIPAVTPHYCVRELAAMSPLPIFNICEPLQREIAARSIARAVIFGTRFVIESALFGMVAGVEFVSPRGEEIEYVHRTYVELARRGKGSEEDYRGLSELAGELIRRERVDAVVLAGTDFSLLFHGGNADFPHVDCAALHVQAIADGLMDR